MPRFIFGGGDVGALRVAENRDNGHGQRVLPLPPPGNLPAAAVGGYCSPHTTRNGNVESTVIGNSITPNQEEPTPSHYPHHLHRRQYLPGHRDENLVYSSVHWKWRTNQGKSLDKGLMMVVNDEMSRRKTGVTKKKRSINIDFLAGLIWALLGFVYSSRYMKTRAEALVRCVFHGMMKLYPDLFKDALMKESRAFLRKHVMHAYKIQRTIDTVPTGGLNYGSIEGIRRGVEELSRYECGVLPSTATIARCARQLEMHASTVQGLEIIEKKTDHGPVFSFDIYQFMRMLMKGFGLVEHAKTGSTSSPVMICWTLDYAQLTRELGHLTGGIKIVDPRSVDPVTGNLLLLLGKFQSRDLSFPCQLAFVKESKQVYKDCFKSFFEILNSNNFVVPATEFMPEMSNFDISSCQDLSSGWKTTTLGGGCKTTEFFCSQCMVSRKTVVEYKVLHTRCPLCSRLSIERCYCREIVDETTLDMVKANLTTYIEGAMDEGFLRLDRIAKQSKIDIDQSVENKETERQHIDYQPQSAKDRTAFTRLLNDELRLRLNDSNRYQQMVSLPPEQKREALRELLMYEANIQLARYTVNRHDTARNLAISLSVEKFIPCILHMKMRVVEKVFHTIINFGLERYGDSKVDTTKRKLLAANTKLCMKQEIFGDESRNISCQWKFTWSKSKKGSSDKPSMEKPSLSGNQAQKLINKFKKIVEVVFDADLDQDSMNSHEAASKREHNASLQQKWITLAEHMEKMWSLIEQHEDYSEEQLDHLHVACCLFFHQWNDLTGIHHVTNYIHILGAGHVCYFARKYRNLYRFSQQGWESLNQLIKHFYFNNTNHGGSAGNGGKNAVGKFDNGTISGDHCRPLMRLCQRSIMWKLGLGDAYFRTSVNGVPTHLSGSDCESDCEDANMDVDEFGDSALPVPVALQYGIL
jgi:hypothetical protein